MNTSIIRCTCGRRIFRKNILQISFHFKLFGESFVSIKYKCPRCKRIGEYTVSEKEWDSSSFNSSRGELTPQEIKKFKKMGRITIDEVIDFHLRLKENKNWLKEMVKG
jgi:phage FluMu protein Com